MLKLLERKKFLFLGLIMGAYIIWRFYLVQYRFYDHDEFQHLNATWSLSNGLIPYKDFFEHHFPWLYHFSSWIYLVLPKVSTNIEQSLTSFTLARNFLQLFMVGSFVALYMALKTGHSKFFRMIYLALLCASIPLMEKTIEFRPDVPAFFCFSVALYFFLRSNQRLKNYCLAALFMGCAVMFTQKYLLILPAIFFLVIWQLKQDKLLSVKYIVSTCLVFFIPFLITYLYYLSQGAHDAFIYYNLALNFSWAKSLPHWNHTLSFFKLSPITSILALLGIAFALKKSKNSKWINEEKVFFVLLIGFILALYLVPISALQFYIIVIPALIYFATGFLETLTQKFNICAIYTTFILIILIDDFRAYHYINYQHFHKRVVSEVHKLSAPDDLFLGGHPKFSLYRPSINFHHIVHHGIFLNMTEKDKFNLKTALTQTSPKKIFIEYDYNMKRLPKDFQEIISRDFKPVSGLQFRNYQLLVKEPLAHND